MSGRPQFNYIVLIGGPLAGARLPFLPAHQVKDNVLTLPSLQGNIEVQYEIVGDVGLHTTMRVWP